MARKGSGTNASDMATDAVEYPGLEHWRGTVDEKLKTIAATQGELKTELKENATEVKATIAKMGETIATALKEADRCGKREHEGFEKRIHDLEEARTKFVAKVSMIAGFAGILGGGISSATFSTIFHKLFG